MSNQHITDYLTDYIETKTPTEHAILINGKWGSGKTWLIKTFIKDYKPQNDDVKLILISLYGITSLEDINSEYIRQAYPILSSKGMILGKAVGKAMLKGFLKLDIDGDKNKDGEINLNDCSGLISNKDFESNKHILFFDDVERCELNIVQVLGYINHFVEMQGYKAVILANDDKIAKRWEKSNKDDQGTYADMKEKLIGKTFKIESNPAEAILSFIDNITHKKTKHICKKSSDQIISIYKESMYENLRQIKRALLEFESLIKSLPNDILNNDDFNKHFLSLFLVYTIESNKTIFTGEISSNLVSLRMRNRKKDLPSKLEVTINKYTTVDAKDPLLNQDAWDNIIFSNAALDVELIKTSILNTPYFYTSKTPAWKQLRNLYSLEDEEFDSLKEVVKGQFQNCDIASPQILLHMFGILLTISKNDLLGMKEDRLVKQAKKNIDKLLNDGRLYTEKMLPSWNDLDDLDSLEDLQCRFHQKEFKQVVKYYKQQQDVGKQKFLKKASNELIKLMTDDPHEFLLSVIRTNHGNCRFYDKPILSHIDPALFVETFAKLPNHQKGEIRSAISLRYRDFFTEKLTSELEWLVEVQKLMIEESKKWEGKVSSIHYKMMIEQKLENSIANLKEKLEKKKVNEKTSVKEKALTT